MFKSLRIWPGIIAGLFIVLLIGSAFAALFQQAPSFSAFELWQDPYLRHVTLFSLQQALLSTFLAVVFAIPVAVAIFHRSFWGKSILLKICAMTLVLPVLVGVFGLLSLYGNQGFITQGFQTLGVQAWNIYGLKGILLAHVFFNLPFCVQLFVQALSQIPSNQIRLSRQLGLSPWHHFRFNEWAYLKQQIPHAAGLVFMLCFTSFSVVMALGGGPQATTIELAIYQAIRFDFDLQTGALLALWQLILCAIFQLTIKACTAPIALTPSDQAVICSPLIDSWQKKIWDYAWISAFVLLILPPLSMVIWRGLNPKTIDLLFDPKLIHALQNSVFIAVSAAVFALCLGGVLIGTTRYWRYHRQHKKAHTLDFIAHLILVVPSVVFATGLFLILRAHINVFRAPFLLIILVNGLMALPYVINVLSQPAYQVTHQYQKLCESLGITGIQGFYLIDWKLLRAPIARAFAISFVLSTGDLGAVSLIGSQDFQTLPFYLFQLMGSYQMQAASAAAFMLFGLSLFCYAFIEFIFKRKSYAAA